MKVFTSLYEFRQWRNNQLYLKKSVGFVPTMGALHEGHTSLINFAKSENDFVVVSIFVNPAQFSPLEDFDSYPRTWEVDKKKLQETGIVDALLMPSVDEMYPSGITLNVSQQQGTFVQVEGLSHQLEGQIRPHFFRGVATIVCKLLNVVQPKAAYFGQKDIQQTVVLKTMVRDLFIPTAIRVCPIIRETDGLAVSSRNCNLLPNERIHANILYRGLKAAQQVYLNDKKSSREDILLAANQVINGKYNCKVELEYLSLANPETLLEVDKPEEGTILCGAIRIGKGVRIIDNVIL